MPTAQLLSIQELREHFETALEDSALQRILDASEKAIDKACTAQPLTDDVPDTLTEVYVMDPQRTRLTLNFAPVGALTSVTELWFDADDELLVVDDDYYVDDNVVIRRGAYWGLRVQVVYEPESEVDLRRAILIQLCQLEINIQPGQSFTGAATWQETYQDYEEQKQRLLWSLCPPPVFA